MPKAGLPAVAPVTRVAACAVIANPLAGQADDDLEALIPFGAELGELLVKEACARCRIRPISYGKAAIVGTIGDIEHAAAHPASAHGQADARRDRRRAGDHPVEREDRRGRRRIDVPLGHKDDVWSFDEIDTLCSWCRTPRGRTNRGDRGACGRRPAAAAGLQSRRCPAGAG